MNKENIRWVDIDQPEKKYTFKDLNVESSERKVENQDIEKSSFRNEAFFDSLWGLFQQYRQKRMVNEAVKKSEMWDQFKNKYSDSWSKFCEQAKFLAFFLGASEEKITQAIKKLEQVFINLGRTTNNNQSDKEALAAGQGKLESIREAFSEKQSNIRILTPSLNERNFIQLISQGSEQSIQQYSKFIDMIIGRSTRNIAPLLRKKGAEELSFGEFLKPIFKTQEELDIFERVVNQPGYKKGGGGDVGKAEIALAMFFGDCRLPSDKGDIRLGKENIEVKGQGGTIGLRSGMKEWISYQYDSWSECCAASNMEDSSSWQIVKKKLQAMGKDGKSISSLTGKLNKLSTKLDTAKIPEILDFFKCNWTTKSTTETEWIWIEKFIILFSLWLNQYVKTDQIDRIWIFNTARKKGDTHLAKLFTSKFIQISTSELKNPSNFEQVYNFGFNTLNNLKNKGVDVEYSTRESGAANDKGYSFKFQYKVRLG